MNTTYELNISKQILQKAQNIAQKNNTTISHFFEDIVSLFPIKEDEITDDNEDTEEMELLKKEFEAKIDQKTKRKLRDYFTNINNNLDSETKKYAGYFYDKNLDVDDFLDNYKERIVDYLMEKYK